MTTCVESIEIFSTMTTYILCGWMQYFVVTIHLVIPDSSPMITLSHTSFILLWPYSVIKDNIVARISKQMSSAQCLQSKIFFSFAVQARARIYICLCLSFQSSLFAELWVVPHETSYSDVPNRAITCKLICRNQKSTEMLNFGILYLNLLIQ